MTHHQPWRWETLINAVQRLWSHRIEVGCEWAVSPAWSRAIRGRVERETRSLNQMKNTVLLLKDAPRSDVHIPSLWNSGQAAYHIRKFWLIAPLDTILVRSIKATRLCGISIISNGYHWMNHSPESDFILNISPTVCSEMLALKIPALNHCWSHCSAFEPWRVQTEKQMTHEFTASLSLFF